MKKFLHKNNNMKRIILIFLGLFSLAYAQYSPTSAKTRFVNGISIGTKLDSYFNAADSNAIYWRADSVVMAKYRGTARALSFIDDTAFLTNRFVRLQTGNLYRQTGKMWISDTIYTSGVLRADSYVRTDSILGNTSVRFSGQLTTPNNSGFAARSFTFSPGTAFDLVNLTTLDTINLGNAALPTTMVSSSPQKFSSLGGVYRQELPTASGIIALTSNVTDSSNALRASINTKLNIGDTAAMLLPYLRKSDTLTMLSPYLRKTDTANMLSKLTLDRVLSNGNTSGRAATVGAFNASTGYFSSNLTSAARIRSDKAFFNSSSTTAFDTVLSVIGLSNAPGIVAVTSSGQAIRGVATGGATAVTARSDNINGNALDIINTAGGRLISANNGTTNVFTLDNNGKITTLDSIVGVNQRLTGSLTATSGNFTGDLNVGTTSGKLGVGLSTPQSIIEAHASSSGGEGAFLSTKNTATSALNNATGIVFLSSSGATFNGTRTGGITNIVTDANDGASALTFSTFNGSSYNERWRTTASGRLLVNTTTDDGSSIGQFNGNVLVTGFQRINSDAQNLALIINNPANNRSPSISFQIAGTDYAGFQLDNSTKNFRIYLNGFGGTPALDLVQSTGAATFSSSVTAAQINNYVNGASVYSAMNVANTNSTANMFIGVGGSTVANVPLRNNAYVMNTAASGLVLGTSDQARMIIDAAGATTFNSTVTATGFIISSDRRYKDIISQDGDVYSYTLKNDPSKTIRYGYLSQDVEKWMPNAVSKNSEGYGAVNYIDVLVYKVRQLEKQIEQLKNDKK